MAWEVFPVWLPCSTDGGVLSNEDVHYLGGHIGTVNSQAIALPPEWRDQFQPIFVLMAHSWLLGMNSEPRSVPFPAYMALHHIWPQWASHSKKNSTPILSHFKGMYWIQHKWPLNIRFSSIDTPLSGMYMFQYISQAWNRKVISSIA